MARKSCLYRRAKALASTGMNLVGGMFGAQELGYFWLIGFAVEAIVRVFFAVGVLLDACRMKRLAGATFLVPGSVGLWLCSLEALFR